jgi:pilus assembly protein FimV
LLLDPAGFAAPRVAATPAEPTAQQLNAPDTERAVRKTTHIKVGAKATLRGIAWRVGERSESDLQRMMLAIFRANPTAFEGNINRLHLGALLTIPSSAELAAISKTEAKREIRAQMAAWRTSGRTPARTVAASAELPATRAPQTAGAETPAADGPIPAAQGAIAQADATNPDNNAVMAPDKPASEALDQRIQSLERELNDMKGLLQSEHDQMIALQQKAARAVQPAPTVEAPQTSDSPTAADEPQEEPVTGFPVFKAIAAGLGILAAVLAAMYFRSRRRAASLRAAALRKPFYVEDPIADSIAEDALSPILPAGTQPAQDNAQERATESTTQLESADPTAGPDDATQPALPILSTFKAAGRSEAGGGSSPRTGQDTTVKLRVDTVNLRVDPTRLDYNFLDLDMTAQHVQMPSVLNQNAVVKERRTNLADVLKQAIERQPDRHDLRIKLLELYYSAAATNRQAFLDVVQKFARDRDHLPPDQWDKIAFMGRQIASENPLFASETTAEDDLADCA